MPRTYIDKIDNYPLGLKVEILNVMHKRKKLDDFQVRKLQDIGFIDLKESKQCSDLNSEYDLQPRVLYHNKYVLIFDKEHSNVIVATFPELLSNRMWLSKAYTIQCRKIVSTYEHEENRTNNTKMLIAALLVGGILDYEQQFMILTKIDEKTFGVLRSLIGCIRQFIHSSTRLFNEICDNSLNTLVEDARNSSQTIEAFAKYTNTLPDTPLLELMRQRCLKLF